MTMSMVKLITTLSTSSGTVYAACMCISVIGIHNHITLNQLTTKNILYKDTVHEHKPCTVM